MASWCQITRPALDRERIRLVVYDNDMGVELSLTELEARDIATRILELLDLDPNGEVYWEKKWK